MEKKKKKKTAAKHGDRGQKREGEMSKSSEGENKGPGEIKTWKSPKLPYRRSRALRSLPYDALI